MDRMPVRKIDVRSDEEAQEVENYSPPIVSEMMQMHGFLSWTTMTIGNRFYTVTAWKTPENVSQLMKSKAHREAMKRFYKTDFTAGGMTGVWVPHHLGDIWIQCPACKRKAMYKEHGGNCSCGQTLPEPPPYW
ncbi:hypothetical protein [Dictyobacter arantiisoli]|uniref:ABM domain-containing protein n=1 Tax=Dictyobacter arantiisoli TaxID=2014874 RepID=A0A5A5TE64_9CHLR|nr:hypothetical protein [Dictyobacter arantiisoli]GCF09617.1 hypothetical protein KDI_31810 [Dictyobacter arantiisoli]